MQVLTPKTFRVNNYCVYGQTVSAIYQIDAIMLNRRLTKKERPFVFQKQKARLCIDFRQKKRPCESAEL